MLKPQLSFPAVGRIAQSQVLNVADIQRPPTITFKKPQVLPYPSACDYDGKTFTLTVFVIPSQTQTCRSLAPSHSNDTAAREDAKCCVSTMHCCDGDVNCPLCLAGRGGSVNLVYTCMLLDVDAPEQPTRVCTAVFIVGAHAADPASRMSPETSTLDPCTGIAVGLGCPDPSRTVVMLLVLGQAEISRVLDLTD